MEVIGAGAGVPLMLVVGRTIGVTLNALGGVGVPNEEVGIIAIVGVGRQGIRFGFGLDLRCFLLNPKKFLRKLMKPENPLLLVTSASV